MKKESATINRIKIIIVILFIIGCVVYAKIVIIPTFTDIEVANKQSNQSERQQSEYLTQVLPEKLINSRSSLPKQNSTESSYDTVTVGYLLKEYSWSNDTSTWAQNTGELLTFKKFSLPVNAPSKTSIPDPSRISSKLVDCKISFCNISSYKYEQHGDTIYFYVPQKCLSNYCVYDFDRDTIRAAFEIVVHKP